MGCLQETAEFSNRYKQTIKIGLFSRKMWWGPQKPIVLEDNQTFYVRQTLVFWR